MRERGIYKNEIKYLNCNVIYDINMGENYW